MKEFIFLYPIPEIIDFEIENTHCFTKEEAIIFKEEYKRLLNASIDSRYRKNNYGINYAIFNGSTISNIIDIQDSDKIIEVGIDYKTHTTKQPNGEYLYPDQDYILNQLKDVEIIRIAGFHMWDCVERLAKRSYKRGLETLVDEDLTEFFTKRIKNPNFTVYTYPTFNPRQLNDFMFKLFMKARKDKPWLWQDY